MLTQILGVFGFVLAVASLLWQVYTHIMNRVQRARVTARVVEPRGQSAYLAVDVYNCGAIPLYVKSVTVEWAGSFDYFTNLPLETDPIAHKAMDDLGTLYYQSGNNWSRTEALAPHDACTFYLFRADTDLLKKMIGTLRPEEIWLSVKSHGGELCRIKGQTFWPQFISVARCWGA